MNAERTAIARQIPSRPARVIVERGLLKPTDEVLNFGCGRAVVDTVLFAEHCANAQAYDPHYAPLASPLLWHWDVVYCGFVLNVLRENDRAEVIETVRGLLKRGGRAYFAVRGYGDKSINGEPHEDGVVTTKGTFQRAFSPAELLCELVQTFTRVRRITGTAQSPFVILEASIR